MEKEQNIFCHFKCELRGTEMKVRVSKRQTEAECNFIISLFVETNHLF